MRFTTKDTAPLHNTYAYTNLNPITNTDPTGQTAQQDIWNSVILGASIILGIITIASTIYATPASFIGFSFAIGVPSDILGTLTAMGQLITEHAFKKPIPEDISKRLTIAETTLTAIGLIAAAPIGIKTLTKLLKKPQMQVTRKIRTKEDLANTQPDMASVDWDNLPIEAKREVFVNFNYNVEKMKRLSKTAANSPPAGNPNPTPEAGSHDYLDLMGLASGAAERVDSNPAFRKFQQLKKAQKADPIKLDDSSEFSITQEGLTEIDNLLKDVLPIKT